jgi:hypothetical protein
MADDLPRVNDSCSCAVDIHAAGDPYSRIQAPIAKEPGTIMEALERMRQLLLAGLVSLVVGCSAAPIDPAARAAWEARDEQRALECQQQRGRYLGGSCTYGGQ